MSVVHVAGEPENDGERTVLRLLRDQLPDDWHVASNFWLEWKPGRYYECDAAAFSPNGKAYLIETKAWLGQIRGNEREWELPGFGGGAPTYRPNPVKLTQRKCQVLRDHVRMRTPALATAYFEALVVLVSDATPTLEGNFASQVVLARDLAERLLAKEPRHRPNDFPVDGAERLALLLTSTAAPIRPPDQVGTWKLLELVEATANFEVWQAVPAAGLAGAPMSRLKRHTLDSLLTGAEAIAQRQLAVRELEALTRLSKSGAQVLPVSAVEETEDGFIVVTEWPRGESLGHLLSEGSLDPSDAKDLFRELLATLASVHKGGVVHRNLNPSCVYYDPDGALLFTDFDYARIPAAQGAVTRLAAELSGEYVAPEVREQPSAASARSDVWSVARIGMQMFGDAGKIPGQWQATFAAAQDADPDMRPVDADDFIRRLSTSPGLPTDFEPNDEIDERYVVRGNPIRTGGISIVVQVFDTMVARLYAAKFVRPEYVGLVDPSVEYMRLAEVPEHPGIAKPTYVGAMHYIKRHGRTISRAETFLLTPWVDGTPLDQLIPERLPVARVLEVGAELAAALAHLHLHGVLHRDVKPENILILADGRPKLIDFNVSGDAFAVGTTEVGTVTYRPSDAADEGWDESCDLFALAGVLLELLMGKRLTLQQMRSPALPAESPPGLAALLASGVAKARSERLKSADDLRQRLIDLRSELQPSIRRDRPAPTVPAAELERADWNPYQHRLLSFFSQARTSNAGTRGLDEFSEWFYVPTQLDAGLTRDLLAGNYSLVIVTGNAGDGKTAFIQQFETELERRHATVSRHADGNGVTASLGGRSFVTNWDGSQDEGDESSDRVLEAFFAPFLGDRADPPRNETRLIAINEGRILDFLESHRSAFRMLAHSVERLLDGEQAQGAPWLALVNLNMRALTSAESPVVRDLMTLLSAEPIWAPCEGCRVREWCYARANAASLRDPVLGPRIIERVRKVLDVARLRRRLHLTMRDLRSALAYTIVGDRTCEEIAELVDSGEAQDSLVRGRYYNAFFAGQAQTSAGPGPARDRLLRLIGTLDVARTPEPELDARLWAEDLGSTLVRGGSLDPDIAHLRASRETARFSDQTDHHVRDTTRFVHCSLRRLHFMEREDPDWIGMLPYRSLAAFLGILEGDTAGAHAGIVEAISKSEGQFSTSGGDGIAVRLVGELEGADRSFVVHPASLFALEPVIPKLGLRYIEFQPDTVRLEHRERENVRLDVDLDLFETLERVRAGFQPSREEMQGAWLNLRVFKEQLGAMPANDLLLTRGDRYSYRIARSGPDSVSIEAART